MAMTVDSDLITSTHVEGLSLQLRSIDRALDRIDAEIRAIKRGQCSIDWMVEQPPTRPRGCGSVGTPRLSRVRLES